jgi:prepilin-type N-terminal cleavage/methylation domain-containing protein
MIRNPRAGFTLLEVLVATVIMGVAVSALIIGLTQSVKNASRLADYDRAVMLARTKMNDLLLDANLPFDGLTDGRFDTGEAGGIPSGWSAALKPYDVPPNAGPGTVVLQQIALEVWWQPATGGRRTMRLESYRPQAIPNPQQNMVIQ